MEFALKKKKKKKKEIKKKLHSAVTHLPEGICKRLTRKVREKMLFYKCMHDSTHTCTQNDTGDEGKVEAGCCMEAVFLTSATAWPPYCAPPTSSPCVLHNVIQSTNNSLSKNSFH